MEEALKMRNLLEEFNEDHGVRPPSILGVREHIFTGRLDGYFLFWNELFICFILGCSIFCCPFFFSIIFDVLAHHCCSVSSLAWFMSNQETSFVTIGQRVLARPLKYVLLFLPHVNTISNHLRKFCEYDCLSVLVAWHH